MQSSNYFVLRDDGVYLARAGGGGSSSGGSSGGGSFGGGGYSGSSYGSSSSSSGGDSWGLLFSLIFFGICIYLFVYIIKRIAARGISSKSIPHGFIDAKNDKSASGVERELTLVSEDIFYKFQSYWSEFDVKKMKPILESEYYKKITLELNVLKNYERQNTMSNVNIAGAYIKKSDSYDKEFSVYFVASADDKLIDLREDKVLFEDKQSFAEIWNFVKSGKRYILAGIDQTTEDVSKFVPEIAEFATKNGFYYDPDFGWLMMPSRGAIFGPEGFGNADINNHVIGYYKDKIVEFYSYESRAGSGLQPITVAQAVLPKRYDNILVTEKSWYKFKPIQKGLMKVETESIDFNKKFSVWAAEPDKVSSFELLATNFMEKIYSLDFEINIEVIDNVLYLHCPGQNIKYQDLLEVLSWAFEEMKM